ncbi:MAG: SGNH/GDSL hydrolase family protein [Verrucomicrobiales bacterium]|nr:SGNH/GDSL hydrolase family protein [Verrucomicrobiales bacterium]
MKFVIPFLLFLAIVSTSSAQNQAQSSAPLELFADGETVCFLGDSITAGGYVQTLISDYYLTRFPNRTVKFVNAGRSGDTARGSLNRLKEDVIDKAPTAVAIMFGMNDVGRGYYVKDAGEAQIARQQSALSRYEEKMTELVARIRSEAGNPKLIFQTPSPFDETVQLDRDNNQPGCNTGLANCADIVRTLAKANGAPVIDYHVPMTALNLAQQKNDPTWTIVGPDRVHPGNPGRLMMAWLFLKAQGAPGLVSQTVIDAVSGKALETKNVAVNPVEKTARGLSFTSLESALPFAINGVDADFLALIPVERDLNQQPLSVKGLVEGTYELHIDDILIGQFGAKQLGEGINLAQYNTTPQYQQAKEVAKLNSQKRNAEAQACSLMNSRRWMQSYYKIDPDDSAALQKHIDHFEDKKSYSAVMAKRYQREWPNYGKLRKQAIEYEQAAEDARQPVAHSFTIYKQAESQ